MIMEDGWHTVDIANKFFYKVILCIPPFFFFGGGGGGAFNKEFVYFQKIRSG